MEFLKKKKGLMLGLCALLIMLFLPAPNVQATLWTIEKDWTLYGTLDQHNVDPVFGDVSCGPTSAVNSFVYLQNKYPDIYGESLVEDSNNDGEYSQGGDQAATDVAGRTDDGDPHADLGIGPPAARASSRRSARRQRAR